MENYSLHRSNSSKQILQIFARFHIIYIWFQMNDFHLYDLFNIITLINHFKNKYRLLVTENPVSAVCTGHMGTLVTIQKPTMPLLLSLAFTPQTLPCLHHTGTPSPHCTGIPDMFKLVHYISWTVGM